MKTTILLLSFFVFSLHTVSAQQTIPADNTYSNYNYFKLTGDKTDSSQVVIWPNPANDHINIFVNSLLQEEKGQLAVYSMNGMQMILKSIGYGNNTVYLNLLPSGMYFVRIIRENGVITTSKLIITR